MAVTMSGALRPTLVSLLLMTTFVAGLAAFVESRRLSTPARAARGPAEEAPVAIRAPEPAVVEPPPAPEAPPSPALVAPTPPPAKPRMPDPPVEVAARPPLPLPKPQRVEPLMAKARSGDPAAQMEIGLAYAARGDWKRAAAWMREAAIAGVAEARLRLAEQYRQGRGVPADPLEAFIWTRSAAEQGLPAAQLALGDAYERGLGVPASPVEAYAWYAVAAEAGNEEAAQRRARLAETLSPAERETGDSRAATIAASLAPSDVPDRNLVAEIQRLLRMRGYDPGVDDGFRGERTTQAIKRYQSDRGLRADGRPTEALLERLRAEVRRPPPPVAE